MKLKYEKTTLTSLGGAKIYSLILYIGKKFKQIELRIIW